MLRPLTAEPSGSQTAGPFFRMALHRPDWADLTPHLKGTPVRIVGRLLDGDGVPVPDGMLEIWQADANGQYADGSLSGFGRVCTETDGGFAITTVVPGAVRDAAGALHAPHVNVHIFARGLLRHLFTRIYFADRPTENAEDVALKAVPADRRGTLLAKPDGDGGYRFDIILQGRGETVFFDLR